MSPALLVLGGLFAGPVLRWAREAGLATALADPDPHAPLRRAAEEFHPIPRDDAEAHAALARRLAKRGRLAGVHASAAEAFALLPALSEAAPGLLPARAVLQRLLSAAETRAFLEKRGLAVAHASEDEPALDVFAFFRDGAFVPAGIALRRRLASGDVVSVQPSGLAPAAARAANVLVERAARALGLGRGPLQATLLADGERPALVTLQP